MRCSQKRRHKHVGRSPRSWGRITCGWGSPGPGLNIQPAACASGEETPSQAIREETDPRLAPKAAGRARLLWREKTPRPSLRPQRVLAGRAHTTARERERACGCERSVCVGVSGERRVHVGTQGVCGSECLHECRESGCERVWPCCTWVWNGHTCGCVREPPAPFSLPAATQGYVPIDTRLQEAK